jgi:PKD repeat protein
MGAPVVNFVTDKTDYCEGDTVFVTPVNMPIDKLAGVTWDFGDSSQGSDFNDQHIYDKAGTFTITLTAKDIINGCTASTSRKINILKAPVAAFNIPANNGCQPLNVTFLNNTTGGNYFSWDFGNGNRSTDANGQQLFTKPGSYNITLRATDMRGCTDTITNILKVNPRPVSKFESSSLQTCFIPIDVRFINLSQGADDYRWNFGNGTLSKDTNPVITFNKSGDYTINLIASNMFLCSDTSEIVYHAYNNPVADFKVDTVVGCDPYKVQFINLSANGLKYYWKFGEQGYSEDKDPAFTFEGAGTYTVSLKVVGQGGCNDSITKDNYIKVNPSPISGFEYTKINGLDTVQFHNSSSGAISYVWNFGDGLSSTQENPWHRYTVYGTYKVSLTSVNKFNCKNTIVDSINFELFKGLYLPNALSPGDASQDVGIFKAVGTGLVKFHLVIYDAWGNLIWETTKLERGVPVEAWDGTFNGKPLPPDVYVWHLKEAVYKDGTAYEGQRYGSITLIK